MSGACPPYTGPPPDAEAYEVLLKGLRDSGASDDEIGDAAMDCLLHLLEIEHMHVALLHACAYERYWDDERKLDVLERMSRLDMLPSAAMLCWRWRLYNLALTRSPQLHKELFPELPPRTQPPGKTRRTR